jgi:hypothetical protein
LFMRAGRVNAALAVGFPAIPAGHYRWISTEIPDDAGPIVRLACVPLRSRHTGPAARWEVHEAAWAGLDRSRTLRDRGGGRSG